MATVTLEQLVKRYGQIEAVRAIDLSIADGEFVALVGPSGCGKSTTLRMIAGLEEISSGTIRIGGEIVNELPPRARNISMVFQSYALYPHMSVRENLGFSLKIAKRPPAEIDARVAEASEILRLGDLLDRRPSQLSGGQRQRVAMGRAIVRKPEVFLFDEPLSNLDAKLRTQMRTEIKLLHARVPSTVIYVTHDQVEAMTLADRIVIMRDGRIEQVGSPDDVFRRPATRFVAGFIGSPGMNLIEAEVADGRIVFNGGDWLPIPDQFKKANIPGGRVTLGLRPDDVYPTGHGLPSADGRQVVERNLPVLVTEPLGNETLVFVGFGGNDWVTRMLSPAPTRGRANDPRIVRSRQGASFFHRRRPRDRDDGRLMMAKIERIELRLVDIPPKVKRTDAIQSFVSQETPIVAISDSDGAVGTGYSYTIGTGGSSVMRLLADHLAPRLIGKDAERIEAIWRDLEYATHATTIGAISSLALAAIDTALWDLRCKRRGLPLWIAAGGAADRRPLYTTEGGWLHIDEQALVEDALAAREQGFMGSKIKIGRPHVSEDYRRLAAVRAALGPDYEIMTDANQGFMLDEAIRRAGRLRRPRPGLDRGAAAGRRPRRPRHASRAPRQRRSRSASRSIRSATSANIWPKARCSIVQVDVARIGGITPWLKVAHAAEAFDMPVCPHFLMELHVSLACAVPNGKYVEYIPQLDDLTTSRLAIEKGMALAPSTPGIGVEWDLDTVKAKSVAEFTHTIGGTR